METKSDRFGLVSADSEKAKSHREALGIFRKTWTGKTLLEKTGGELAPEYFLDDWFRVSQRIVGGKWAEAIPATDYGPKEFEVLEIPNGAIFLQELPDGGLAITVDFI